MPMRKSKAWGRCLRGTRSIKASGILAKSPRLTPHMPNMGLHTERLHERFLAAKTPTPRSSGHVSMDTASPIFSRGQSTTIATGTVGARCLTPSEHAARRSPMYADGRRIHLQPHSSPLQLPDTTVAPPAPGYVARTLARA